MNMSNADGGAQAVYFSHGGGPLPILGDEGHRAMVEFMTRLPAQLTRPDAIVVVSAHWVERAATLLGAPNPPMFYDYYGFPREAYSITYPAPGHPALSARIAELVEKNGIPAHIDPRRGFDHGLFIPLKLMYPQADIPCTQLSLLRGLDPAAHIALGKALRGLVSENLLFIGSGFSFHNLNAFFGQPAGALDTANDAFQDWLIETCVGPLSESDPESVDEPWLLVLVVVPALADPVPSVLPPAVPSSLQPARANAVVAINAKIRMFMIRFSKGRKVQGPAPRNEVSQMRRRSPKTVAPASPPD